MTQEKSYEKFQMSDESHTCRMPSEKIIHKSYKKTKLNNIKSLKI